jgi:RNA polymerase sigma factor (TIGR02999 family)
MGSLTVLLEAAARGDKSASDRIYNDCYAELHRLAQAQLRGEAQKGATSIVHEAFIKLNGHFGEVRDRTHFFSLAARAMRQIVLNHVRDRQRLRRGGAHVEHVGIDGDALAIAAENRDDQLLLVDTVLERLHALEPRLAQLVEMRFFAGMELSEIAPLLDLSERTLMRDWRRARAYIQRELEHESAQA